MFHQTGIRDLLALMLVAAIVVVVGGCGTGDSPPPRQAATQAPAWEQGDWDGLPIPPDAIDELAQAWPDVPRSSIEEQLGGHDARKDLLEEIGREHAQTFAGSWYDYAEQVWHLRVSDPEAAEAITASARRIGVEAQVEIVPHSWAELEEFAEDIMAGRTQFPIPVSATLDTDTLRVGVLVEDESQAAAYDDPRIDIIIGLPHIIDAITPEPSQP